MPDVPSNWPEVVFRGEALASRGIDADMIRALLHDQIALLCEEELPIVDKVIIADSDLYGEAIREELQSDDDPTHTEHGDYVGIAKTLPIQDEAGRIHHTIVIRAGVVWAALGEYGDVEPIMEPGFGRYVLQHELGHCVDHLVRGLCEPVGWDGLERFSIERIGLYYRHILMAEFAACLLSGGCLDDRTFDTLMQLDGDSLQKSLQGCDEQRQEYLDGHSEDLYSLAIAASQTMWLVLVQFAKACGHMQGLGRASASMAIPQTIAQNPRSMEVLEEFGDFLGEKSGLYPEWPLDGWEELSDYWSRLSESLGYRFESMPQGDALWI